MSLNAQFNEVLKSTGGLHPSLPYAIAMSGGLDSAVLCELSRQAGIPFFIVHYNFMLRSTESDGDEEFVRSLGKKYEVKVLVKRSDAALYAKDNRCSIQEAARELRYGFFSELYTEKKASFTLLGHHANDNIETLLLNFLRGTGLHGLTGMPFLQESGHCLRPLLFCTRNEIVDFAVKNSLTWREDSSNFSEKYTRNFLRNRLLPQLKEHFPAVESNLLNNLERFNKTDRLYRELVEKYKSRIVKKLDSGGFQVPVLLLQKQSGTSLIYEIIRDFHFHEKQVEEVVKLLESETGHYIQNEYFRIIKNRKWLIIAPQEKHFEIVTVDMEDTSVAFATEQVLKICKMKKHQYIPDKSATTAFIDAKYIQWPLLLRKWKAGDYFYPLGMRKKKKVSRFLIDLKLSKPEKEKIRVLVSGKHIIWIVGLRIDDRFKITDATSEILKFTLSSP